MRDRTIIPTNLLDWPRCSTLLPDQKLIIHWLWACPYFSCAGAGLLPINAAAATLGLDAQALAGGLKTLVAAQLIEIDIATGEVAVLDWFRFHSFKSPIAVYPLYCLSTHEARSLNSFASSSVHQSDRLPFGSNCRP